jgi:hypothetical protein
MYSFTSRRSRIDNFSTRSGAFKADCCRYHGRRYSMGENRVGSATLGVGSELSPSMLVGPPRKGAKEGKELVSGQDYLFGNSDTPRARKKDSA